MATSTGCVTSERGVQVTLLLQARVEYRLLHYASRALYGHLLAEGVMIAEYHKSFLHAKVAVIDTVAFKLVASWAVEEHPNELLLGKDLSTPQAE